MERDRCKWKIIGNILGSAGAVGSIAAGMLLTALALGFHENAIASIFILMSILNATSNIVWLYAIYNHKVLHLQVIILWWIVPLSLWFLLTVIYSLGKIDELLDTLEDQYYFNRKSYNKMLNIIIFSGMVFGIVFYSVAVTSYIKLKHIFRIQRAPNRLPISLNRSNAKYIELETL
ncbi:uncharacterized protein LOC116348044 [Contarinia nasturtii]|uniref:uncharacterized protein LOC116348044 n=1 Tax=Contarinia nasturtii TaxID=265458 RepID=UPI0012D3A6A6|nr:uncharacterized protein LOC116348044 [Contarinia nasturtii]